MWIGKKHRGAIWGDRNVFILGSQAGLRLCLAEGVVSRLLPCPGGDAQPLSPDFHEQNWRQ